MNPPFIFQDVLAVLFSSMGYRSYLELGVGDGSMVRKIHPLAAHVSAVDITPCPLPAGVKVYKGTTREVLALLVSTHTLFDMIFIDADHAYESVLVDLLGALEVLSEGGTIALHDTDPSEKRYLHPGHCNNAYKIVDYLATRSDLTSATLPTGHEGLTIVRRREDRRALRALEGP